MSAEQATFARLINADRDADGCPVVVNNRPFKTTNGGAVVVVDDGLLTTGGSVVVVNNKLPKTAGRKKYTMTVNRLNVNMNFDTDGGKVVVVNGLFKTAGDGKVVVNNGPLKAMDRGNTR